MKKFILVGFGVMGKNHERVLNANWPGYLTHIIDPAYDGTHIGDIQVCRNLDGVNFAAQNFDAAIISTPTELHYQHASFFMNQGINVFLEKPICEKIWEAESLIKISEEKNVKLFIGHIERYNPVIAAIKDYLSTGSFGKVFTITTNRVGISPARDLDLDVSLDLLIHDVDICNYLIGSTPASVGLVEHPALSISRGDVATVIMKYNQNQSATCHANWITPYKEREIKIATTSGLIRADFITQQWSIFTSAVVDGNVISNEVHMPIKFCEPLKLEYEFFLNYISGAVDYSPQHALDVLRVLNQPKVRLN
jgi:predicted dehydrogenase